MDLGNQDGRPRVRFHRASLLGALLLFAAALAPSVAQEDAPYKGMNDRYEAFAEQSGKEYRAYLDDTDRKYDEFVQEIERRWGEFVPSTRPMWSTYAADLRSRGEVRFDEGSVVVEVLVDGDAPATDAELSRQITAQTRAMMSDDNPAGRNVLENLVDMGDRTPATVDDVKDLVESKVSSGHLRQRRVEPPDGEPRTVFSLTLPMVPDHLARASEPFIELAHQQARRFGLPADLVLAVIHTESWFNPLARSPVPAFGLMQLVPRSGALDAYRFLYGTARVVDANYLYQPENNVELGCAYLHLLMNRYFGELNPLESRTLAAIAGYNCGPGNTRLALRSLDPQRRVPTRADPRRVENALLSRTPEETRSYLRLVTERRRVWH
jgi:membrane-bound lytic murein transglycosylase C